jgi:hypothetical protein
LSGTFRKGAYKRHRESILHDREKARLPDAQEDAVRYRDAKAACGAEAPRIAELQAILVALPEVIEYENLRKACQAHYDALLTHPNPTEYGKEYSALCKRRDAALKEKTDATRPYRSELGKIHARTRPHRALVESYGLQRNPHEGSTIVEAPVRRAFMMRCVRTGCEGFVSTAYKCGLCEAHICKDCHAVKTDDAHTCAPDAVASVTALKRESRPCPKCAAPISKIDGCDQIWCTLCKTAFSWNTGKIETGVIHNPHYYQWMRESGQTIPRRDVPGGPCGGGMDGILFRLNELAIHIRTNNALDNQKKADLLYKRNRIDQIIPHYNHIRVVTLRQRIDDGEESRRQWRVMRLVGEMDDAAWKKRLQMQEKAAEKERAWRQLYEMSVNCFSDIITPENLALKRDSDDPYINFNNAYKALYELTVYVTREAYKITKLFDCILSYNHFIDKTVWDELTQVKKRPRRPAAGGAGREDGED